LAGGGDQVAGRLPQRLADLLGELAQFGGDPAQIRGLVACGAA
jgi:hypothetical protein